MPRRVWRACPQPRFYVCVALCTRHATRIDSTPFPLLVSDPKEDRTRPVGARPRIPIIFPFVVSNSHTEPHFGQDVIPLLDGCRMQSRPLLPKCGGWYPAPLWGASSESAGSIAPRPPHSLATHTWPGPGIKAGTLTFQSPSSTTSRATPHLSTPTPSRSDSPANLDIFGAEAEETLVESVGQRCVGGSPLLLRLGHRMRRLNLLRETPCPPMNGIDNHSFLTLIPI